MKTSERAKDLVAAIEADEQRLADALERIHQLDGELAELKAEIEALRADPAPVVALAPPDNLQADTDGPVVRLTWADNATGEDAYVIEQRDTHGDGGWTISKTVGPDTNAIDLVMPNADWRYDFRVRATRQNPADPSQELTSDPAEIYNVFVRRQVLPPASPPSPPPSDQLAGLLADPVWSQALRPADRDEAIAAVAEARRTGRPLILRDIDFGDRMLWLEGMSWVWIEGCRWAHIPGGWFKGHAIFVMRGLSHSAIINNVFARIGDADIAGGYGQSRNLHILNNWHHDTKQGLHLLGGGSDTTVEITGERFEGLVRMAIECQGGGRAYRVRGARAHNWRNVNRDSFFISMAAIECATTLVEDSACWMADYPVMGDASNRLGIGVELAGVEALCRRVRVIGPWVPMTALSSKSRKSRCRFEDVEVYRPNLCWGKPHEAGLIYNDGGSAVEAVNVREVTEPPAFD